MHNVDGGAIARSPVADVWQHRGEGLGKAFGEFFRRLGRARARRAARRDLHRLDDRLLKDIGLRRDQVDEFVDTMFRRGDNVAATRPTDTAIAEAIEDMAEVNAGDDDSLRSAA